MFSKKKVNTVEDTMKDAEVIYQQMIENVNKGIINKDSISYALTVINNATHWALKENKRHLLNENGGFSTPNSSLPIFSGPHHLTKIEQS